VASQKNTGPPLNLCNSQQHLHKTNEILHGAFDVNILCMSVEKCVHDNNIKKIQFKLFCQIFCLSNLQLELDVQAVNRIDSVQWMTSALLG